MARQDQEKQKELEPKRMQFALDSLLKLGVNATQVNDSKIEFSYKNELISFWPYSGWHSGKSIVDGRGIKELIKQIKQ